MPRVFGWRATSTIRRCDGTQEEYVARGLFLAAGADGAWVGTAFVATPEATEVPDSFKRQILRSDGQDTTFTTLYDLLGDPPWPEGIAGRVYRNPFVQQWSGRDDEIQRHREELATDAAVGWEQQDPELASVYQGQSAVSVNEIRPAAQVLRDICDVAEELLRSRSLSLLGLTHSRTVHFLVARCIVAVSFNGEIRVAYNDGRASAS